jgi:hypothetical protein
MTAAFDGNGGTLVDDGDGDDEGRVRIRRRFLEGRKRMG